MTLASRQHSEQMPTNTAIGYCHNGTIHDGFHKSLLGLLFYEMQQGRLFTLIDAKGAYIAKSRNLMVRKFLSTECEWLLSLDNDMQFEPTLLESLMDFARAYLPDGGLVRIAAALYLNYIAGQDASPCSTWLTHRDDGLLQTHDYSKRNGPETVASVGMGGTLIHRSVLEAMRDKYEPTDDWPWFGHDLHNGHRVGEDVSFCLRAASVGFQSWGVPSLTMGHIKTHVLNVP